MKENPTKEGPTQKAIYVAWNRQIWGPGIPGRSLEDLERAKAEYFRQKRGASAPAPSLPGTGNETAVTSADTIEVVRKYAGWYDVVRNGVVVNAKGLRKEDAEALAEQLRHGGTA